MVAHRPMHDLQAKETANHLRHLLLTYARRSRPHAVEVLIFLAYLNETPMSVMGSRLKRLREEGHVDENRKAGVTTISRIVTDMRTYLREYC